MSELGDQMPEHAALRYLALCREFPDADVKVPITFVPNEEGGYWVAQLPEGAQVQATGLLALATVLLPLGFLPDMDDAGMMVDGERVAW